MALKCFLISREAGRIFFSKNKRMQIKIFSIPVVGGEDVNEALNLFLRSKKILQTEAHIVNNNGSAFWSFCVKYLEDVIGVSPNERSERVKIDYRDVLDEATFKRFSKLRDQIG
jgi:hypothetical protein